MLWSLFVGRCSKWSLRSGDPRRMYQGHDARSSARCLTNFTTQYSFSQRASSKRSRTSPQNGTFAGPIPRKIAFVRDTQRRSLAHREIKTHGLKEQRPLLKGNDSEKYNIGKFGRSRNENRMRPLVTAAELELSDDSC